MSVMLFCAQLDPLPTNYEAAEMKAMRRLFPGPFEWCTPQFLKSLRHMGFPKELPDLPSAAVAARARVALHENSRQGGLQVRTRAARLRLLLADSNEIGRRHFYKGWVDGCFIFSLESALNTLDTLVPHDRAFTDPKHPEHEDKGWQAKFTKMVRPPHEQAAMVHLRRRLDRWTSTVLQGHRPERFIRHIKTLCPLVAPRVLAAVLRTALNGWVTARRFQSTSPCVLGCGGLDSIEHYKGCCHYHRLASNFLGLARPTDDYLMDDFIGLVTASTSCANSSMCKDEVAALRAIAIYALYRVHGAVRHGADHADTPELFRGYIRQATEHHSKSCSLVCRAFKRTRRED